MSISTYCAPEAIGAFCWWPSSTPYLRIAEEPRPDGSWYRKEPADDPCLRTVGIGTTVRMWERNGYDDSDFFATYRDENGEWQTVGYSSTRGWTYTACANVDASPEIMDAYEAHLQREARQSRAKALRSIHAADIREAKSCGVTVAQIRRITGLPEQYRLACISLLRVKKFRSEFRQKLATQVRDWLMEKNPKYSTPLSGKQISYVTVGRDFYSYSVSLRKPLF